MNLFAITIPTMKRMLENTQGWLREAATVAEQRKFDVNILLSSRLYPDQFALVRQIQVACDTAKFTAARLAGQEAPAHPDTEQTWEEINTRLQTVIDYLAGFTAADFEGAEERTIALPFLPGMGMSGADYAVELQIPNFFFHITTAYAILRHSGVVLGKRPYLGAINIRPL